LNSIELKLGLELNYLEMNLTQVRYTYSVQKQKPCQCQRFYWIMIKIYDKRFIYIQKLRS